VTGRNVNNQVPNPPFRQPPADAGRWPPREGP
jgi:hypothetical protein